MRMNAAGGIRTWSLLAAIAVVAAVATGAAACGGAGSGNSEAGAPGSSTGAAALQEDITVFAASSLTDAFNEIGKAFTAANPKASVAFNFASSSTLATQINEGGPADVFASADSATMKTVTDKGNASDLRTFATNLPVVVVPKSGSPVAAFADLAKPGIKLVLAAPEVPIGNYARTVLANASAASGGISADFSKKVIANLKSNESNVKAVLAKIQTGEADAGIVYGTDAAAVSNDVKTIVIPQQYNVIATYPIATVTATKQLDVATAFVQFVLGSAGQGILAKWGFMSAQ
jgi:molybdate transport system substrate-binding protein